MVGRFGDRSPVGRCLWPAACHADAQGRRQRHADRESVATTGAGTPVAVPLDLSTLPVDPEDWHALGPADAKVTIVEFSEFM